MTRAARPPDTFAARLAALRSEAGLTAYALAKAAGTTQSHLARLERGEQQPSLAMARKLARALGHGLSVWDEESA